MTKFLSKLFLCGILLSSINGYCQDKGLFITSGAGIPMGTSEINIGASNVVMDKDYTTNYNVVIGDLYDSTLAYSTMPKTITISGINTDFEAGNVIDASNFVFATKYTDSSGTVSWVDTINGGKIIPIAEEDGCYYLTNDGNTIYNYKNGITQDDSNYGNSSNDTTVAYNKQSDVWYEGTDQTTAAGDLTILQMANGFALNDNKDTILFSGDIAYKDQDNGTWKLLSGDPLARASLDTDTKKLTIGDILDTTVTPPKNDIAATLTVTQLGDIKGGSTIELVSDEFTTGANPVKNQWATSLVLEPGSIVGESGKPVTVNKGIVNLSGYISANDENKLDIDQSLNTVHLTVDSSTVDLFSNYIPSSVSNNKINTLIQNFNKTLILDTISSNITTASEKNLAVQVPYVISDGTNSYKSVEDMSGYLNNQTGAITLSFHAIDQAKIKKLFNSNADIKYDIDAKNILTALVNAIKTQNTATGTGANTITIDALSFKKWDTSINFNDTDLSTTLTGYNGTDKKFKIVIEKNETIYDNEIEGLTDGKEPKLFDAEDGTTQITYSGITSNKSVILNEENNTNNTNKGPIMPVENSKVTFILQQDINRDSIDVSGKSDVNISGNGKKLNVNKLSIAKDNKMIVKNTTVKLV